MTTPSPLFPAFHRVALPALFALSVAVVPAQTTVYQQSFGTVETASANETFADMSANFVSTGAAYADYGSTYTQQPGGPGSGYATALLTANYATDGGVADGTHFAIDTPGGGLRATGIDTSGVIGQSLTLSMSTLVGWRVNNNLSSSAGLYPYGDESETFRVFSGNLNDYLNFEISGDGGSSWNTLTFTQTVSPVDITKPWTVWSASLDAFSFVGGELQYRLRDSELLKTVNDGKNFNSSTGLYKFPLMVDNITLTASAVPEPATFALIIGGAVLAMGAARRRRAGSETVGN